MGYCPLSIRQPGTGLGARAQGAQVGARGTQAGAGVRDALSRWQGRAGPRGQAPGGRRARRRHGRTASGAGALGGKGARQAGVGQCRARGLGVLLGQWAVHSVHSACFWPGLTQYCS